MPAGRQRPMPKAQRCIKIHNGRMRVSESSTSELHGSKWPWLLALMLPGLAMVYGRSLPLPFCAMLAVLSITHSTSQLLNRLEVHIEVCALS
eukprot:1894828-Amphidinium_carterae.1